MRVAVVSDLHGNLTAFEAVLADVRQCSPALVLHGGDWPIAWETPWTRQKLFRLSMQRLPDLRRREHF